MQLGLVVKDRVRERGVFTIDGGSPEDTVGSVYYYIEDELAEVEEPMIEIRFSDHGEANGGGYRIEKGYRHGEADLSCDPVSGKTWQDATAFVKEHFNL